MRRLEVSIIMATYNRQHLICDTLRSIENQIFVNWECLVIDDGSTDGTKEAIKPFLDSDTRFKYFKRGLKYQKGLPGCRNMGLDLAKGDYIVFFDDDDIVHPQLLELCIKEFNLRNVDYCRYERTIFYNNFDKDFEYGKNYTVNFLNIENLSDIIIGKIPFNSCQIMWRKECFENNYFNERLMYAEEWELYTRILLIGLNGVNINKVLFFGRKHPNSNTGEFHTGNKIRRGSQIEASLLIMTSLKSSNVWDQSLEKFFIRMGFLLKSFPIIKTALFVEDCSSIKYLKYKIGYEIYPLLKPILRVKAKILNS